MATIKCPKCNKLIRDTALKCPYCRAVIREESSEPEHSPVLSEYAQVKQEETVPAAPVEEAPAATIEVREADDARVAPPMFSVDSFNFAPKSRKRTGRQETPAQEAAFVEEAPAYKEAAEAPAEKEPEKAEVTPAVKEPEAQPAPVEKKVEVSAEPEQDYDEDEAADDYIEEEGGYTYDPNHDGYYDRVMPIMAEAVNKAPWENKVKIGIIVLVVVAIAVILYLQF